MSQEFAKRERIPLDNAATSWPKPDAVYRAVDDYQRCLGAPHGRGAYGAAMEVHSLVTQCRSLAAHVLGVKRPERVVFTFNATDSLNLAIHGLLRPGDHVVTSSLEHNSISRPLRALEQHGVVKVTRLTPENSEQISPEQVRDACRPETRLICLLHASNVTGTIQPIERIGAVAREREILFLVDAAQTAGTVPISFDDFPVDLLACAGHKGLLGPLGTGLLCLAPGIEAELQPTRLGGTGTQSELDVQPESAPDRYESGNHNVPGLCGLKAGLEYLIERTVDDVRRHERELTALLLDGIAEIPAVALCRKAKPEDRVGVVSVTSELFDPQTLATLLANEYGIETRAGYHCAPGMHRWLGTYETGGTVRFSPGPFTTQSHIERAIEALRELHSE